MTFSSPRWLHKANHLGMQEVTILPRIRRLIRDKDARITIFSKCIVTIQSLWIAYMFRTLDLKTNWWDEIGSRLIKIGLTSTDIKKIEIPTAPSDRDLVTSEFEEFIAYAYLLLLFSSLESSLRIIVKVVYPARFLDRQGNFKGNFNGIAKALLKGKYPQYKDLLELLRLLRNTNDNNGVYMPETIQYDSYPMLV